jgi:hypothetical protein
MASTQDTSISQSETTTATTTICRMQSYVNDFYGFLKQCLGEYIQGKRNLVEGFEKHHSFMDYMCYRLYGDFGLKRKFHRYGNPLNEEECQEMETKNVEWIKFMYGERLNPNLLIQFFYDKSIPSYNKNKSITRLCRHMIFDMKTFSIVSLGVLKSLDEDEFYEKVKPSVTEGVTHYQVVAEEFLEGTMVIYNEGMSSFNYHTVTKDTVEEAQIDKAEQQQQRNRRSKNFTVSTRRKIGTSFFNKPGKTFYEMFLDNNEKSGIDFTKVPKEELTSLSMVFNVEHEDNRIISPQTYNRNTLVGAYAFKPISVNADVMRTLQAQMTEDTPITDEQLDTVFSSLSHMSVTEFNVDYVKNVMKTKYDLDIRTPVVYEMIDNTKEGITSIITTKLSELDEYSPGVMVRDAYSSMRYKVRKGKYKELLELKGHTPISIHDKNVENLFKCYWRIRSNGGFPAINKFLKVFDNEEKEYRKIFDDYKKKIHEFTHNLYIEYMSVFVDKKKHAREIPYLFAPLIGDLHTDYKATRKPTTKQRVVEYVNAMPPYKVYWRLFTPEIGTSSTSDEEVGETTTKEEVAQDVTTDKPTTTQEVTSPDEVIED